MLMNVKYNLIAKYNLIQWHSHIFMCASKYLLTSHTMT